MNLENGLINLHPNVSLLLNLIYFLIDICAGESYTNVRVSIFRFDIYIHLFKDKIIPIRLLKK